MCSFMRVSRALFVSPIYTWLQLQGIWYATPDFFSSGPWSLTLVNYPRRVGAYRKTVRMLYLLHTCLTSSLRPATWGMNAVTQGSSAGSLTVGFAGHLCKGLRISIPFQDSSGVVLFNLCMLPLGNGSRSVEEAGENTLFHMAWVVRREVQISVCVGGLSVDILMSRDPSFLRWRSVSRNGSLPSTSFSTRLMMNIFTFVP